MGQTDYNKGRKTVNNAGLSGFFYLNAVSKRSCWKPKLESVVHEKHEKHEMEDKIIFSPCLTPTELF
jgi:hypothetical protein